MNISYKWLKRYIDFNQDPRGLAALLTSTGLECDTVEEVESIRGGLRGIVIGKVLTCTDHPDSDHLHITTVDLGSGEPVQIVCGAPNVAAGQTVVVATVGTILYDGDKELKIKKSKIRGVESYGMICAEDEIGLGTGHAGIMVLPDGAALPGTPAAEYFNVSSDHMLEVELTPNRVDAASHLGVARDIKARWWCDIALAGGAEEYPGISMPPVEAFAVDRPEGAVKIIIEDRQGCPRYSGVTIRGVKVQESPEWLKNLLLAVGQRPVNNIVDITNYILHGIGQPLHCFDLNTIDGGQIVVRNCPEGTPFVTLDGVERKLSAADLMICSATKPLCIAGVFGGLDSGVTEQTTDVFIESAYFNPTSVRRTARRHGLNTDASFRYERGTDPNLPLYALKLATILIKELAGGEVCGEPVDIYPHSVEPFKVELSYSYMNGLIGKEIPRETVDSILRSLEIEIAARPSDDVMDLRVPTYRVDVTRPCDVVEDVLRIYGYNNVEISTTVHSSLSYESRADADNALRNLISEQLTAIGFNEIMNNSLTAESYYADNARWSADRCVRLLNPLSSDLSVMRQTLLYGGLESIAYNINRRSANLKFYEFGNVYSRKPGVESTAEAPLAPFVEGSRLALWLTGDMRQAGWAHPAEEATVFDLKAIVANIFLRLGINPAEIKLTAATADAPFSASLKVTGRSGNAIGEMGIVDKATLTAFDIKQPVCYGEFDWQTLVQMSSRHKTSYRQLPRTMAVKRDLALLVDTSVTMQQIENAVREADRKLLRSVSLFDVYEGDKLPAGKKSYAITMTLQDDERTLNDKQIDAVMKKIVSSLTAKTGATLR